MVQVGGAVGNYQVTRLLGEGGMGAVFEAVHQYIGRRAAIKVLHADLSQNPQFVTRFLNEARAVNLVRHPGLVEIFEFGILPDGTAFCVMEYLEGESLFHRLREAPKRDAHWGPEDLRLVRQIAQALQVAHDKGIVHRDLKPENVMIVPDPERRGRLRAKILDFGIAKMAARHQGPASARYKTQTGVALGTPEYMAPEQCMGEGELDGKVDVYALGVILFELVSGQLPFRSDLAAEIMVKHVREAPRPLRELDASIPVELEALVTSMLAKAPAERPTMAQVSDSLRALLEAAKTTGGEPVVLPDGAASGEAGAAPGALSSVSWDGEEEERTEVSVLQAAPAQPDATTAATVAHAMVPDDAGPPPAGAAQETTDPTDTSRGGRGVVYVSALPSEPHRPRRPIVMAFALGGLAALTVLAVGLSRSPPPLAAGAAQGRVAPAQQQQQQRAPQQQRPEPAACLVTSTPEGAEVVRAADQALLGTTPLRIEGGPDGAALDVIVRRSRHADQRVALSWGADCRRQVTLAPLGRPPGRQNVSRPARPARPPQGGSSVQIPVIH